MTSVNTIIASRLVTLVATDLSWESAAPKLWLTRSYKYYKNLYGAIWRKMSVI